MSDVADPEVETLPVAVTVLAIEHVHGRGPPAYRHASSGRLLPAIGLPEVLRLALAAEIAAAVRAAGAP